MQQRAVIQCPYLRAAATFIHPQKCWGTVHDALWPICPPTKLVTLVSITFYTVPERTGGRTVSVNHQQDCVTTPGVSYSRPRPVPRRMLQWLSGGSSTPDITLQSCSASTEPGRQREPQDDCPESRSHLSSCPRLKRRTGDQRT